MVAVREPAQKGKRYTTLFQASRSDYWTWHWTQKPVSKFGAPEGVSLSILRQKRLAHSTISIWGPDDPDITGRAGIARIKALGKVEFACCVFISTIRSKRGSPNNL